MIFKAIWVLGYMFKQKTSFDDLMIERNPPFVSLGYPRFPKHRRS